MTLEERVKALEDWRASVAKADQILADGLEVVRVKFEDAMKPFTLDFKDSDSE